MVGDPGEGGPWGDDEDGLVVFRREGIGRKEGRLMEETMR